MDCSVFIYRIVINVYLCFVKWRKMLGKNKHIVCYMYTFFSTFCKALIHWLISLLVGNLCNCPFNKLIQNCYFMLLSYQEILKHEIIWIIDVYDITIGMLGLREGLNRVISNHYCLWVWTRPLSGATFILINCFILILNRQPLK